MDGKTAEERKEVAYVALGGAAIGSDGGQLCGSRHSFNPIHATPPFCPTPPAIAP